MKFGPLLDRENILLFFFICHLSCHTLFLRNMVRKKFYPTPRSPTFLGKNRATLKNLMGGLKSANMQAVNKVVFALLACMSQFVNKFGTSCYKFDDIIRLVARLFQQVRYSPDITILLQLCVVNLVTFLLYHDCIRLVRTPL